MLSREQILITATLITIASGPIQGFASASPSCRSAYATFPVELKTAKLTWIDRWHAYRGERKARSVATQTRPLFNVLSSIPFKFQRMDRAFVEIQSEALRAQIQIEADRPVANSDAPLITAELLSVLRAIDIRLTVRQVKVWSLAFLWSAGRTSGESVDIQKLEMQIPTAELLRDSARTSANVTDVATNALRNQMAGDQPGLFGGDEIVLWNYRTGLREADDLAKETRDHNLLSEEFRREIYIEERATLVEEFGHLLQFMRLYTSGSFLISKHFEDEKNLASFIRFLNTKRISGEGERAQLLLEADVYAYMREVLGLNNVPANRVENYRGRELVSGSQ